MDARMLVEQLRERGVRLEAVGGRIRYRPKSALSDNLLELLAQHKARVLELLEVETLQDMSGAAEAGVAPEKLLTCPVCGTKDWIRSIPGGGVFCGGCTDPAEIGLEVGQYRPANEEELARITDEYAHFRALAEREVS